MPDASIREIKLFYCYAREDRALRDELEIHLSLLRRQYRLSSWHDREILPGERWEEAIDQHISTADIVLLLISPHFLNSDYCYGIEMQRVLERHKLGICRVVPILLRPTYWEDAPFSHLQILPTSAIPISRWPDRDEAFADVVTGISKIIKELLVSLKTKEDWLKDGTDFENLKRYEEALVAFEQAIRLDPNFAAAYNRKGYALIELKHYEEALVAFEQAIRLDPNFAAAYNGKSYVLIELKIKEGYSTNTTGRPPSLTRYRLSDVFVLSGTPEVTFVPRQDFLRLKLALEQPGRGIVIEGPSGVGKTTLVEKAVEDLKNAELKLLPIQETLSARNPDHRNKIQTLRKWHDGVVIIDDFHRLDLTLREELVDYLKELADTTSKSKKLAIVGIPRTGQSLVDASFDIATRLDIFPLGQVEEKLVVQMIEKGEEVLNILFDRKAEIVFAANGSLNLAQFLCFHLCELDGITQTQDKTKVIHCDIKTATEHVMTSLARKFEKSIRYFIAMGGAKDLTGLRLLEDLAMAEDGFLSLSLLKENKPELVFDIECFIQERWMEKLYKTCLDSANHFFFDPIGHALVIDDPQLAFYLKNVSFPTLARKVGKESISTQRKVFISYSHEDAKWLERLHVHLKPIEREGTIDLWDDTKIKPGIQWKQAIIDALEIAKVAVLLISADFLGSDFIAEHELPTLLARAQAHGTTILPVILSPSLFTSTSLGAFQAINNPDHSISDMTFSQQEQIFVKVAQIIMKQFPPDRPISI
jgi:tetratricopeptide (TPR) repeat protein